MNVNYLKKVKITPIKHTLNSCFIELSVNLLWDDHHFLFPRLDHLNQNSSSPKRSTHSQNLQFSPSPLKSSAINRSWSEMLIFGIRAELYQKYFWLKHSVLFQRFKRVDVRRRRAKTKLISFEWNWRKISTKKRPRNEIEVFFYLTVLHVISLVIDDKLCGCFGWKILLVCKKFITFLSIFP